MSRLPKSVARKRLARLAAVQALYNCEVDDASLLTASTTYYTNILDYYQTQKNTPDTTFLKALLQGVTEHGAGIDVQIEQRLTKDWTMEKMGPILRNILRCAIAELLVFEDIPSKVTITEYVQLADSFFSAEEAGFVNGLLDKLARENLGDL